MPFAWKPKERVDFLFLRTICIRMYICSFILKFVYKYNDIQKLQPEVLCDIESSEASKESFCQKRKRRRMLNNFETLRKYLGHVPGFTRSAPAAFLLTASRCTFWYLVQPLDRIPVETLASLVCSCTCDRHAHAPNVETVRQVSLNVPNNPTTIPKIVMIIWYTNSASSCPL